MSPTVSVLMPVYNAERYLVEAVEGVLAQTFADFEFIVIDDGSTDGSLAILQRYAERDSRVRLISRPNTGYVVALNEMLEQARGEFVARMDADDICMPSRFMRQIGFLRDNPACLAVGSRVELIDSEGARIGQWDMPLDHVAIDQSNVTGNLVVVHPSLMARRAAMVSVGGYRVDVEGSEDLDILLRMAEIGKLANLADVLLQYRRHQASFTHAAAGVVSSAAQRVLSMAWRRRGLGEWPQHLNSGQIVKGAADYHQVWAWMSLKIGNRAAARKHARRAFWLKPLSLSSWRVVYCAIRGY